MSVEPAPLSFPDFLVWEEHQETKHEYVDGRVVAFAGGTIDHAVIAANLISSLRPALGRRACLVLGSDAMVETPRSGRYPDVVVTCDPRDAGTQRTVRYPLLIIEILSESSAATDCTDKLEEYTALPSLEEYVLTDSRKRWVQLYRRTGESWVTGAPVRSGTIRLHSVDLVLSLDDVYAGASLAQ